MAKERSENYEINKAREAARKRQWAVRVRLTEEEYAEVRKNAFECGDLSLQDFGRLALLNKEIVDMEEIHELMAELKRIGNNLNQVAKALNSGGHYNQLVEENQKELNKVWQQLKQYLQSHQ